MNDNIHMLLENTIAGNIAKLEQIFDTIKRGTCAMKERSNAVISYSFTKASHLSR